jgi:tetratricopeptide (TPR) repeat protein
MAVAPILVLLYDRTFISGSWSESVRRHAKLHLAFAATWLLLIFVVSRGGGITRIGAGLPGWTAVVTQGSAALKYLTLSFWPEPLVFDYGRDVTHGPTGVLPLMTLVMLAGATIVALVRRPLVAFLAATFLAALLPGIIVGLASTQAIAEHRMYLALVAPITFVVAAGWSRGGRLGLIAMFGIVLMCGALTFHRNDDYASALTLWRDTVAKVPENPRAHYNLANALSAAGRAADAVTHYQTALRIDPRYAAAHHNLGGVLLQLNRPVEAVAHYRSALQREPDSVDSHVNLAAALVRLGRMPEAVTHYETAARSGLLAAEEQLRFGRALAEVGRIDEALVRLLEAVRLNHQHAETRVIAGMVLSAAGRTTEALQHFTAAVVTDPDDAAARAALGDLLIESDRPAEALVHYEAALRLQPGQAAMFHTSIGNALIRLARAEEAIFHYESALQLNPDNPEARTGLKRVRAALQRRGLLKN